MTLLCLLAELIAVLWGLVLDFAVMCFSLVDLLVGNLEWLFGCWVLGLCFRDCAWGC